MITKSLKTCFRPACFKRRATAALSWLDCISTVVSKTKHFRNYLFRLQHDTSTIQTSNLIQSNRTAIAENKTQQDAMSACTSASWLWCGGIVRNYIFGITFRNNTLTWLLTINRRLNFFTRCRVISANILFQILLWRTCILLLFVKFHVSIIISVINKLRKARSQFHFLYFLYNNTFLMYS